MKTDLEVAKIKEELERTNAEIARMEGNSRPPPPEVPILNSPNAKLTFKMPDERPRFNSELPVAMLLSAPVTSAVIPSAPGPSDIPVLSSPVPIPPPDPPANLLEAALSLPSPLGTNLPPPDTTVTMNKTEIILNDNRPQDQRGGDAKTIERLQNELINDELMKKTIQTTVTETGPGGNLQLTKQFKAKTPNLLLPDDTPGTNTINLFSIKCYSTIL